MVYVICCLCIFIGDDVCVCGVCGAALIPSCFLFCFCLGFFWGLFVIFASSE